LLTAKSVALVPPDAAALAPSAVEDAETDAALTSAEAPARDPRRTLDALGLAGRAAALAPARPASTVASVTAASEP